MDGYLKIKTKLDNSEIDKDVAQLENKIKKLQEDNSNISTEQGLLQKEIDNYEKLKFKANEYKQKIKELKNEKEAMLKLNPSLAVTADTPEYANIKSQITDIQQKYAQTNIELSKQTPKIDKVAMKLNKIKAKQSENNSKIAEYRQKIEQINLNKVQNGIDSIGQKIQTSIGKIGRMTIAVFGIRTAFSAVRQAMNAVSQYNPQISADFEYMRYCIANLLTPAIQGLVRLLYTVLSYINAIANAWFGINLFGNSSVKNFRKMQKSMGGTAKSAKEIQKSLQGFDEMNVLQDNSNNSSSNVGSVAPSMDLSGIQGNIPEWLQWIINNKDLILGTLGAIVAIIGAIKIANFISNIAGLTKRISNLVSGLVMMNGKLKLIKALGLGLIITGVILLIKDVIAMITNPCWENFGKILTDIGIILAGIALIMGSWVTAIIAVIAIIAGLCIQLFNQEGAILSVEKAEKNLEKATKDLESANNSYISSVDKAEEANKKLEEAERKTGLSGAELFKQVQQGTLDYKDMTEQQKEVYKAYLNNETAQRELKEATDRLSEAKQKEKIASWENKLATMAEAGQYDEYKKSVVDAFKNGELSAEEARDLIGKSMSGMSRDSQKTFMEDLPNDIKNGLDPKNYETMGQKLIKWFQETWKKIKDKFSDLGKKVGDAVGGALKGAINAVLATIERMLNTPIRAINGLLDIINTVPGINIKRLSTLNLPRLAKGGVISQPTQAIIGEAGKEAVVPLENNMEWLDILATKLANKIGSGDAPFVINMDGRTVQRGIARRERELAFAKNGR